MTAEPDTLRTYWYGFIYIYADRSMFCCDFCSNTIYVPLCCDMTDPCQMQWDWKSMPNPSFSEREIESVNKIYVVLYLDGVYSILWRQIYVVLYIDIDGVFAVKINLCIVSRQLFYTVKTNLYIVSRQCLYCDQRQIYVLYLDNVYSMKTNVLYLDSVYIEIENKSIYCI